MAIIVRFVSCIVFFHFLLTFDFLLYINAFSLFSAFSVFIIWIKFFFHFPSTGLDVIHFISVRLKL